MTQGFPGITTHVAWPHLKPFFRIENYKREGGNQNPRFRLELASTVPKEWVPHVLAIKIQCCACGNEISPIRSRTPPRNKRNAAVGHGLYFACACPLSVNVGCSRGPEARAEYQRVRSAIWSYP